MDSRDTDWGDCTFLHLSALLFGTLFGRARRVIQSTVEVGRVPHKSLPANHSDPFPPVRLLSNRLLLLSAAFSGELCRSTHHRLAM
jgi:hypothetical protein